MENYIKIKWILIIILLANLFVAMVKIVFGFITKSSSLTADGFHSLSDGTSNIVGIIGITFANMPVDKEHPYGHRKFEIIASMIIAGMLFIIDLRITYNAILRIIEPTQVDLTLVSIIVLFATLIINIIVYRYEFRRGKELNSYFLISDALHTKSDIYTSIGVLVTIICIKMGLPIIIDSLMSLFIAFIILKVGVSIFISAANILSDKAVLDDEKIREITLSFAEVKNVHGIRSRGVENDYHIDMHIKIDPNISVLVSHALIHSIEKKIREEFDNHTQVIIHVEPYIDPKSLNESQTK